MNQELLSRASALCASSEHCCHDIQEKLCKWGATQEESDEIIDFLIQEKYIDEERFSRAYSKDKMRYNHWGRQKIDQGLRMLQINPLIRKQALSELPEQEYLDILTNLLQSKQRSIRGKNSFERQAKLIRFALGRGFEMGLIRQCLPEEKTEDDAEDFNDAEALDIDDFTNFDE